MVLLNAIGNDLEHYTNRNYAIVPEVQLLIALRYYATGVFQVSYICESLLNLILTLFIIKNINLVFYMLYFF